MKCVIELIGECEVPGKRCRKVIECMVRHIIGVNIPQSSIPSERSSLRFADRGHVLAKYQAAEHMMNNSWDLHTDGTSRSHKKYVGQQITTQHGSMSLGFNPAATEDTQTLMSITVNMLKELIDV